VPIFVYYVIHRINNDFKELTKFKSLGYFNKNSHVGQYLTIGKIISKQFSLRGTGKCAPGSPKPMFIPLWLPSNHHSQGAGYQSIHLPFPHQEAKEFLAIFKT